MQEVVVVEEEAVVLGLQVQAVVAADEGVERTTATEDRRPEVVVRG